MKENEEMKRRRKRWRSPNQIEELPKQEKKSTTA